LKLVIDSHCAKLSRLRRVADYCDEAKLSDIILIVTVDIVACTFTRE